MGGCSIYINSVCRFSPHMTYPLNNICSRPLVLCQACGWAVISCTQTVLGVSVSIWHTLSTYVLTARSAVSGLWVGDCFIYNNSAWRLNYCVGSEVTTMYHLDRPMYLLGYLASHSKVYLIDKVSSASLLLQHYLLHDAHAQLHHSLD